MIKRIVRLTLKESSSKTAFADIFRDRNPQKIGAPGCRDVKVMKDVNDENVFYTVSHWDSNEDLEAYRNSDYFKKVTWPMVKEHLAKRAEAFSLIDIEEKK